MSRFAIALRLFGLPLFGLPLFGLQLFGLALLCLGCPPAPKPDRPDPVATSDGKALYVKYCKLCHGEEGEGYAADNANALTNADFLMSASDTFIYTAIERGRPGTAMAGYTKEIGGPLSYEQIRDIMVYLRSFQKEAPVEVDKRIVKGDAKAAEAVFKDKCAQCHGDKGQGKTALSLNNPMFLASASDGFIRHAIAVGRRGTPMPAFEDDLSETDIDNLTRLIRSWTRNVDDTPVAGEIPPTFEQVVVNPEGPNPSFELRDGRYIGVDAVKKELDRGARMVFLDARPTSDWIRSHIPGALPFPYYDTGKMIDSLPKDGTWIISYCACPHAASGKVMDALRSQGFDNTAVLDEGILVWTARGYPLTFGATP